MPKITGFCRLCQERILANQTTKRIRDKDYLALHEDFITVHKSCYMAHGEVLNRDGSSKGITMRGFWKMPSYETFRKHRLGKV